MSQAVVPCRYRSSQYAELWSDIDCGSGIYRGDGYVAVIGQLLGAARLEYIREEGMLSRKGQDQIDMIIGDELIGGLYEIEKTDEIEFGIVLTQVLFEF